MGGGEGMGPYHTGMGGGGGSNFVNVMAPRKVYDYYVVLDSYREEAIGVIAKEDFNNRVEISSGTEFNCLQIFNRWATEKQYPCKGITKAEYGTYIEFGIPDMGVETSWKKWLQSKLKRN